MYIDIKPQVALKEFIQNYSDNVQKIDTILYKEKINSLIKYYRKIDLLNPLKHLESEWFNSLPTPAYNVYSHFDYFVEVYACWNIYSRSYLRLINKQKDELFQNVTTIADLGNGLGLSTVVLSEMFPQSTVYGTNFKDSDQWKYCEFLQNQYNFNLIENTESTGKIDLIFASEYFEHILEPIKHLREIIQNNSPEYLVIANSFGTVGIGHFKEYLVDEKMVSQKKISRIFFSALKENGYVRVKTGFFNNSPGIFKYTPELAKKTFGVW